MTSLRSRETLFIVGVQRLPAARALVPLGRALSLIGEHAAGWILLGLVGAVVDSARWQAWVGGVVAVVLAHGLSIAVKRVVRRPRPGSDASVTVYASAPSKLSFPSSHAASTMAAAVVYTALVPVLWPVALVLVVLMGASRVLLGMHFVTDVLAGFALGLLVGVPAALVITSLPVG
ncbi:hypothetical protein B7R21_02460 [Subtercola boreus]|uniref:Phosphatidic acid phosphatase type 2/haloperoxidase domain-containing protein n=1 Tax=Subtercola boreus TaxID=120213 RepID=A0A3E0W2P4_9MICO|nr:phosphatase PAP2 family protein [Subtercola boreus]RFA16261.1 hypothetical protein B7R21_02460 [Subtercola boreus]